MKNQVDVLVESIRTTAAKHGMYLHRFQTNAKRGVKSVSYALHSSEIKPAQTRSCDGPCVILNQIEGKTDRCEAYRKLANLLSTIG